MNIWILIFIQFYIFPAMGEPIKPPKLQPGETTRLPMTLLERADESQRHLGKKLHDLSHSLDSYFGADRIDEESISDSRIRINLISNFMDREGDSYDANVRTRIALPNTEKRLNLVFQNISRSFTDDGEGEKDKLSDTVEREDYAAGLRYQPEISKEWNIGADTGIKLVSPPDPFVRLRMRRTWWPNQWEIRATETIFWFDSEGFGHTESLELDRKISDDLLFRWSNMASWRRQDREYQFDQALNMFHRISERWAFLYFLRMVGSDNPVVNVEGYSAGINFRRKVKPNWLYYNIQPAGNWPRERNFIFVASISFKLEVLIGEENP